MNMPELKKWCQDLVDLKIKMEKIQDEIYQIKLEVFDETKGGVKCKGGIVNFADEYDIMKLDENLLKSVLKKKLNLHDEKIEEIIVESKKKIHLEASVNIKLIK
ncbi:MAG: hypothetical protein HQ591_12440 [candidate division Zixibacteria bacterium]|nr:hypothetical protein [Candidatus Tariuqbacter arcticus]